MLKPSSSMSSELSWIGEQASSASWTNSDGREDLRKTGLRSRTGGAASISRRWKKRAGRRPFTILDTLHRESLLQVLDEFLIRRPGEAELQHLTTAWHRLDPWPDSVSGLYRLRQRFFICPLSNGNVALLARLSKRAGLPWDLILCAETAQAYKPKPEAYLRNAALLALQPQACMLVAAHNSDLAAARAVGFRTAFVLRPNEHGPAQRTDLRAEQNWDVTANSFEDLADQLHCPTH
jgi:2-haloacid dehalogenase